MIKGNNHMTRTPMNMIPIICQCQLALKALRGYSGLRLKNHSVHLLILKDERKMGLLKCRATMHGYSNILGDFHKM